MKTKAAAINFVVVLFMKNKQHETRFFDVVDFVAARAQAINKDQWTNGVQV